MGRARARAEDELKEHERERPGFPNKPSSVSHQDQEVGMGLSGRQTKSAGAKKVLEKPKSKSGHALRGPRHLIPMCWVSPELAVIGASCRGPGVVWLGERPRSRQAVR